MFYDRLKTAVRCSCMLLALVSAMGLGLMGCSEQAASPPKQETAELTPEQEFAALLKEAETGEPVAQLTIGSRYWMGDSIPKDSAKAAEWFQKAAAQGNTVAQFLFGSMYRIGEGLPKDAAKAVEWYQKAAAQGHAAAQSNLGSMYLTGEGFAKDVAKAAEWYQKAAAQGNDDAQSKLGRMYLTGEGIPKDAAKAVGWFQKAAVQGNEDAQLNLGRMYLTGEGIPKDAAKAVEWYQKAAAQGNDYAQVLVGMSYAMGDGISKDLVLAYAWFNIVAGTGKLDTTSTRDLYERQLSSAEKSEAQRLSSNWKVGQILVREGNVAATSTSKATPLGTLAKQNGGTAFFVNKSGHAITNHHVIDGCKEVRIEGRDGVVKVITSDAMNDLALLQVSGAVDTAAAINADSAKLRQGSDIVVFGFPLNAVLSSGGNLTPGVVSALTGLGNNTNQIQITAPIQPGSSGSPVLSKKGEVVGVVAMKLSDAKMAKATGQIGQNVNFAVGGQTVKSFLDAHKVTYATGGFMSFDKSAADLADEARKWTTVVECWR